MTLGVDLSPLFTDICLLSQTTNLQNKKMVYYYIQKYAEKNEELSIMALNTFIRDCSNEDHKIVGMAIRTMTSISTLIKTEQV